MELFGKNKLHINIAAVRFQQGALAYQREQLQDAWDHFSECLRARQKIYAYSQGIHLEVSTVLVSIISIFKLDRGLPISLFSLPSARAWVCRAGAEALCGSQGFVEPRKTNSGGALGNLGSTSAPLSHKIDELDLVKKVCEVTGRRR